MDIGIIVPALDHYGGAQRLAIECIQRWQRRHKLTVYSTIFNQQLLREHGVDANIACRKLTERFEGPQGRVLNATLLPKVWRAEIGRHEIYHAHHWATNLVDLHPMVWYPHEPLRAVHDLRFDGGARLVDGVPSEPELAVIEAMDRTVWPERVVANSRYSARYIEQAYGHPVADVVYPGVTAEDFIELPIDKNLFVTISQLGQHKRVQLLIEAISLTDETQLIVIGSGPERDYLAGQAATLGVENRVFFMSGLTNRELHLILARACAFLFSPINEPFGIAVLEAMAAGLPVIAVNEGGYVEVCDQSTAFLVPPSPWAFAEKMSLLQANPDLARVMGRAAKQSVVKYSWDRTAGELEGILSDVATEWRASHPSRRSQAPEGTQFGVQYFLWYGGGYRAANWNDNQRPGAVTERPLLGYYNSTKGQTIGAHLDLFERMGLDYVAPVLHLRKAGPDEAELLATYRLFEMAGLRRSRLRFAIQLVADGALAETILKSIDLITRRFVVRDNYLRHKDRPVLFWLWSGAHDGDARHVDACVAATSGYSNLAISLRAPAGIDETRLTFGLFQGMAPGAPLRQSSATDWEPTWSAAYQASEFPVKVLTVSPGYDDRGLDDAGRLAKPYREVARDQGATYRRSMSFVEGLKKSPDFVLVSSFNNFQENTHIEPTVAKGHFYVEMTREWIGRMREKARSGG